MARLDRGMIGARYESQGEITRIVSAEKFNVTSRNFRSRLVRSNEVMVHL